MWKEENVLFNNTLNTFLYDYMASDHSDSKRGNLLPPLLELLVKLVKAGSSFVNELNVLFNDALNTLYLRLYGVGHMVKDHSDSEKGNPLLPHGQRFLD